MEECKVLLLGESYTASYTYIRGADYVTLPEYGNSGSHFAQMLSSRGFCVEQLETHQITARFPQTQPELMEYQAVILSDVGSNTLLSIRPDGKPAQNRLEMLRRYVEQGGGLLMIGGYFSFSGIQNVARYAMTPLAEALPVEVLHWDDRIERPEGVAPTVTMPEHPILSGLPEGAWPSFRGYNRVLPKENSEVVARFENDAFLVGWQYGGGRAFAFTSDCEPNWASAEFMGWEGYPVLFGNIVSWLCHREP